MDRAAIHPGQTSAAKRQARATRTLRPGAWLVLCVLGMSLGMLSLQPQTPVLVWNHSASLPVGLYGVAVRTPLKGDIVVIAPTDDLRARLDAHSALPAGRLLLKQLVAANGDTVCRDKATVTINGAPAAMAAPETSGGEALPVWSGCHRLGPDDVFVLAPHAGSFDSRYFGPIGATQIIGVARPLITFPSQEAP